MPATAAATGRSVDGTGSSVEPTALPGSSQAEGAVMAIAALGGGAVIALGATLASVWRAGRTRRRVQAMQADLRAKDQQLASLSRQLTRVQSEATDRKVLADQLTRAQENLALKTRELAAARQEYDVRAQDMRATSDQLHQALSGQQEVETLQGQLSHAESAKLEAEVRWKGAFDDLVATRARLEETQGELGLTRSQAIELGRELERTKSQLRDAQSRLDRAHYESRATRGDYGDTGYDWD